MLAAGRRSGRLTTNDHALPTMNPPRSPSHWRWHSRSPRLIPRTVNRAQARTPESPRTRSLFIRTQVVGHRSDIEIRTLRPATSAPRWLRTGRTVLRKTGCESASPNALERAPRLPQRCASLGRTRRLPPPRCTRPSAEVTGSPQPSSLRIASGMRTRSRNHHFGGRPCLLGGLGRFGQLDSASGISRFDWSNVCQY